MKKVLVFAALAFMAVSVQAVTTDGRDCMVMTDGQTEGARDAQKVAESHEVMETLEKECCYVTARECYRCGGKGVVTVAVEETCDQCYGEKRVCGVCNGTGSRRVPGFGMYPDSTELCLACMFSPTRGYLSCSACGDTGKKLVVQEQNCPKCGGRGSLR